MTAAELRELALEASEVAIERGVIQGDDESTGEWIEITRAAATLAYAARILDGAS